jgi:hypothetical protein
MTTAFPQYKLSFLNASDATRLEQLAPFFHIDFIKLDEETYLLHHTGGGLSESLRLLPAMAHRRLLAEICSKASKWVHFHFAESCRDTLLRQSDANLRRVAKLYVRDSNVALRRAAF